MQTLYMLKKQLLVTSRKWKKEGGSAAARAASLPAAGRLPRHVGQQVGEGIVGNQGGIADKEQPPVLRLACLPAPGLPAPFFGESGVPTACARFACPCSLGDRAGSLGCGRRTAFVPAMRLG
jgi:hypothetical protein